MRRILLAAAVVALAPVVNAQVPPPTPSAPATVIVPAPGTTVKTQITTSSDPTGGKPDPANCGTPGDPKPCPPLPRVPLATYPANKP